METSIYSYAFPDLSRFLIRNKGKNLEEVIAEYSACTMIPIIEVYKLAVPLIGKDVAEENIKRIESQ